MLFNNIHVPEQWLGKRFSHAFLINSNWHELRKQEKCSLLAPSRSIFYKPRWAWQGVKSTQLISIFTSKKVWKILIKIQLTKSDQKRIRGRKGPSLMPIRVKEHINIVIFFEGHARCIRPISVSGTLKGL